MTLYVSKPELAIKELCNAREAIGSLLYIVHKVAEGRFTGRTEALWMAVLCIGSKHWKDEFVTLNFYPYPTVRTILDLFPCRTRCGTLCLLTLPAYKSVALACAIVLSAV